MQAEAASRLRQAMDKYARLFRVRTMFIYLFPMTLGFAAAAEGGGDAPGYRVALAFLAFLCGSFFSSTLNFYADVESDRLHNDMYKGDLHMSDQPFVTGEMGKLETAAVFLLTAAGCVVLSLLAGREFAWFMIGSVAILGVLYSHPWFRFKNKPVLDIVTNATGACVLLTAGWKLLQPDTWPPIWPLVYGFLFASTLYMPSVANDVPFDAAAGFRTSGVVFGAERLLKAMIPMCALLIPVAVVNFIVPQSWTFKLFIALALPGALVFTAGMHLLYKPPFIRFNASLLVYPIALLWLFYFVYGLHMVVRT
ncbi:UbiA prenyltransferase family protein [Candidatus Solincola tengchongensis]|uniref:UbiA prenyltransferase family protein n=1 Tax=Candidatus Solincola tengchongensis TaxID=2900693 RepID=UPI0025809A3C